MIRQLSIRNFQSHKDSVFDFVDGVNALTGTSRHGKSAVLRAINWVANNRPSGEDHISWWCWNEKEKQIAPTEVIIITDKHEIKRIRSAEANSYVIDGKPLDAVKTDVPKEISDALGFSETNIQAQMDRPFLISESSGEVGRFFNRIVKLDSIDNFQAMLESKKRKTKADLDMNKGNLERVEKELAGFKWVERAKILIEELGRLEKKETELLAKKTVLEESMNRYEEIIEILRRVEMLEQAKMLVQKITDSIQIQADLTRKQTALRTNVSDYKSCQSILEQSEVIPVATKFMSRIASVVVERDKLNQKSESLQSGIVNYKHTQSILDKSSDIDFAVKLVDRIQKCMENTVKNVKIQRHLEETMTAMKECDGVLNIFDDEYTSLKAQMPKMCPTCGQALS